VLSAATRATDERGSVVIAAFLLKQVTLQASGRPACKAMEPAESAVLSP
jgi:hypothetical protein